MLSGKSVQTGARKKDNSLWLQRGVRMKSKKRNSETILHPSSLYQWQQMNDWRISEMNTKPFKDYLRDMERLREQAREEHEDEKRRRKKRIADRLGLNVKNDISDLCKIE